MPIRLVMHQSIPAVLMHSLTPRSPLAFHAYIQSVVWLSWTRNLNTAKQDCGNLQKKKSASRLARLARIKKSFLKLVWLMNDDTVYEVLFTSASDFARYNILLLFNLHTCDSALIILSCSSFYISIWSGWPLFLWRHQLAAWNLEGNAMKTRCELKPLTAWKIFAKGEIRAAG